MTARQRCTIAVFITMATGSGVRPASAQTALNPVTSDIPANTQFPASMAELRIPSHGEGMNGFIYLAGGPGRHPIAFMLHGFPGNEKNTDLMQAIRRAGYNVLYFDYRGSWGSGGTFSIANARDDIASALAWVRDPAIARKYRIDARRTALIGHSMGGWLAFQAAARDTNVACAGGLAAWNIGAGTRMLESDTAARRRTTEYVKSVTDPAAGPLRANPVELDRELNSNADAYDYLSLAPALKDRSILLVSATHDSPDEDPAMHAKMESALKAAGSTHVRNIKFDDDHPFSAHRIVLADVIVNWLATDCRAVSNKRATRP